MKSLVTERPNSALYHFYLGRAYVAEDNSDDALTEFSQAIRLDSRFLEPRLMAANIDMQRQDYKLAGQMADDIMKLTKNDPSARLVKAASLTGMGDFAAASVLLRQLENEYPASVAPRLQIGTLYLQQKKYKEAEDVFKNIYEGDRSNSAALSRLLETYYQQQKYDAAIQYLNQEKARRNTPELQALLADAALRGKKLDLAVQQYTEMAARDPQSAMKHLKLGDAYLQRGSVNEAINEFETARKLAPKDPLVNAMLALGFHNAGRPAEAQKSYRDTLALQSNNPQVKNNLAYLLAETGGNLDEALRYALEASKDMPGNSAMSDTVGWVYFKKQASDTAIQVLSNVVQKEPGEPIYRYHLAAALLQKGDTTGAKRELQTAMTSKPTKLYEGRIKDLMAKIN